MGKKKQTNNVAKVGKAVQSDSDDDISSSDDNVAPEISKSLQYLRKYPMEPLVKQKTTKGRPRKSTVSSSPGRTDNLHDDLSDMNSSVSNAIVCLKHLVEKFEELDQTLRRLGTKLTVLEKRVDSSESALFAANDRITKMEEKLKKLEEMKPILSEVDNGNEQAGIQRTYSQVAQCKAIVDLKADVSCLRQEKLSCDLFLSGPAVKQLIGEPSRNENLLSPCNELLKKISELDVSAIKIVQCFRSKNNVHALRIKLDSTDSRSRIFSHFFKMTNKPFYINEVLVPEKAKQFHTLRHLKRDLNAKSINFFKSVFVRRGEVFYILQSNVDYVCKIASMQDVDILVEQSKNLQTAVTANQ